MSARAVHWPKEGLGMLRFTLARLLIVLALLPPVLAAAWWIITFEHPISRIIRENEARERRAIESASEAAKEWTRTNRANQPKPATP
jgi:hypothetical protein